MSTSGTATFSRNRDQIIQRALRLTGEVASGETSFDAGLVDEAAAALNAMVKHWQAGGVHIWTTEEAILFLQNSQRQYTLSSSSTDHASRSFVQTTLSADEASGQTTISLTATTGMADNDYIGIELDDGTLHWTQINGAPGGSSVVIDVATTGAASSGNVVVTYTTKLVRPLTILSARLFDFASLIETPLELMDRIEYQEYPNKTAESTVNGLYYDRRGGANASGLLYVWPTPADVTGAIKMTIQRPIEDFSAAGNDPDLPQEWIRALTWNLADELADEHGTPEPKRSRIEQRAARFLADVNWWETELTEIQFMPDMRRG